MIFGLLISIVAVPGGHCRPGAVSWRSGLSRPGEAMLVASMSNATRDHRRDGMRLASHWTAAEAGVERVLYSQQTLAATVQRLGREISRHYGGLGDEAPLLVGILNGSAVFVADLLRAIDIPAELDFMAVSSYGSGTETTGVVRTLKDLSVDIRGRHVVLVEDIVDTGLTLGYLTESLSVREPASLKICTLLDKPHSRRCELSLDFVGLDCPDAFVVGYGLDAAGRYRNLPYVGVLG